MIVTLLTDFGTRDYFVAAMKGVILERCPAATLVDITHDIPPQDVHAGAFTLLAASEAFAAPTVHVAVVDPGVGSARRPVVVSAGGHHFVGPDNGLFSYLCDREPGYRARHVTNTRLFRPAVSTTFHGRDVFAPVGAALAAGTPPDELGEEVADLVRLPPLGPVRGPDGRVTGRVLHVDRFGNCVTSLTRDDVPHDLLRRGWRLRVGGQEIRALRRFFADDAAGAEDVFAIWGSAGFLEVAVNRASAAERLGVARDAPAIAWPEQDAPAHHP